MKRRMALATSAAASVAVLGSAMAVAALSGTGLLGFSSGGSSPDPTQGANAAEAPADAGDGTGPTSTPQVSIHVIEDRVLVRSAGQDGVRTDGGASAIDSIGAMAVGGSTEDRVGTSVPSTTSPQPRSEHDEHEYEHDEHEHEYEYEHEHEYEHDEHEYGDD